MGDTMWDTLQGICQKHDLQLQRADAGSRFGFASNTFCGTTLQDNQWRESWTAFYAEQRLLPLTRKLQQYDPLFSDENLIREMVDRHLAHHQPKPCLLHGDLWSGNIGFNQQAPVIFDPACYIGDREIDLAMTRLFGGFDAAFYQGYEQEFPLPAEAEQRLSLYQLYPILNHAVLFGGGYIRQAKALLQHLWT